MILDRRHFLASTAAAAATLRLDQPARAGDADALATTAQDIQLAAATLDPVGPLGQRLAFGGAAAGRVIRIKPGAEVAVRLTNALREPTSLDWHGMRVPGALENIPGLVGSVAAPGVEARWLLKAPEPGTFWLHPPFVPGWADQTAAGLAAVLVVEEPDAPDVDADEVLFIGDRPAAAGAPLPERHLVNGAPWPLERRFPPGSRLRLRLVNGSTRDALAGTFTGAQPLVVAIDGQPSELFRPLRDTIPLGPGARFDLMVDLPRRADATFEISFDGPGATPGAKAFPMFTARTAGDVRPERPPIHSLAPNPTLPAVIPLERSTRLTLVADAPPGKPGQPPIWSLNGTSRPALPVKPLFSVRRGTPVSLGFTNRGRDLSGFRLHGHVMRLLHNLDDGWEPYWRDTLLVAPGQTSHAAFRADNPGKWLMDSPFFDQATAGLRTWFEVV